MSPHVKIDRTRLEAICRKNHIRKLALFGSAVRGDITPSSDIDVLYEFEPGKSPGFEMLRVKDELETAFGGRRLDFVSLKYLSPRIRQHPMFKMEVIYDIG